ncbi:MAG: hypothetical protein Q4B42_04065, partial [Oscillospiraceae bacterium]|nr:hypothetical protein [Oscillospiraceae bacterium]
MKRKKQMSAAATALLDILLIGAGLIVFALFHHVLPVALSPESVAEGISGGGSLISSQGGASSLESGESEGSSSAEALVTETLYESESVRAELLSYEQDGIVCHVIDIYIDDISSLRSYFAEGTYGRGFREHPLDMALAVGAVCAINGDYYGN